MSFTFFLEMVRSLRRGSRRMLDVWARRELPRDVVRMLQSVLLQLRLLVRGNVRVVEGRH